MLNEFLARASHFESERGSRVGFTLPSTFPLLDGLTIIGKLTVVHRRVRSMQVYSKASTRNNTRFHRCSSELP